MTALPINQVVCGNCLEVMREWPAESVNFVCFSPPYWGLRDYGEATKTVWGGDPRCEHEWVEVIKPATSGSQGYSKLEGGKANQNASATLHDTKSNFCSKCGAWFGQLGLEPTYQMYVEHLVEVGREIRRILRKDGSWYLNLGDTYYTGKGTCFNPGGGENSLQNYRKNPAAEQPPSAANRLKQEGLKPKCKLLIPYRVALALIGDGWVCRNDITWHKPNSMPSSVKDRLNTTTERVFHLVKSHKYFYDLDAIREPHKTPIEDLNRRIKEDRDRGGALKFGIKAEQTSTSCFVDSVKERTTNPLGKNPGDFWTINTRPFPEAHFAVYPEELCVRPIKSSCPPDGIILDPMCGAGTTLVVAKRLGLSYIGIDINSDYCEMARKRLTDVEFRLEAFA